MTRASLLDQIINHFFHPDEALMSAANFVFGKEWPRAICIAICCASPWWLPMMVGS